MRTANKGVLLDALFAVVSKESTTQRQEPSIKPTDKVIGIQINDLTEDTNSINPNLRDLFR